MAPLFNFSSAPKWWPFAAADYRAFREMIESAVPGVSPGELDTGTVNVAGTRVWIKNLAVACQVIRREDWRHAFNTLVASVRQPIAPTGYDAFELRGRVRLRLVMNGISRPDVQGISVTDDLIAIFVAELRGEIVTLCQSDLALISPDIAEVGSLAFSNSLREPLPPPHPLPIAGVEGQLLSSGNPFVSSHLLDLGSVFKLPPHGVLAIAPAATSLAVFPILSKESTLRAMASLKSVADDEFRGPYPVSPSLYWCRGREITRVPITVQGSKVDMAPPKELVRILNGL